VALMTDDIDALEAAARAATPGPWEVERDIDPAHYSPDVLAAGGVIVQTLASDMTRMEDAANAAYIAALHPGAALALIARVRRAEAALRKISEASKDECDPELTSERSMGNYDDVFYDGWRQGDWEAAKVARAALDARSDG
jgi:hypothetical protein